VLVAVAAVLGGAVQAAQADPVNFLPAGAIQFKYNDFESLITAPGQQLTGIFTVTTIGPEPFGLPVSWTSGTTDGTQLNGMFRSLTAASITAVGPFENIKFTGGELALFNVPNGTFNSALGTTLAAICPLGVCPAPWVTANFSPGILTGDFLTTLNSTVTGLTGPAIGTGTGFADVGSNTFGTGTNNARFDTQTFTDSNGNTHDLFLESDLVICPGPGCDGTNPVSSHDPVHADVTGVPEPASLWLVGAGLMAAAAWRRRRSVRKG
jgi:hypothetical protein